MQKVFDASTGSEKGCLILFQAYGFNFKVAQGQ